jgi:hypothetical protein
MGAAGLSKHIIGAKGGSEREEKDIVRRYYKERS